MTVATRLKPYIMTDHHVVVEEGTAVQGKTYTLTIRDLPPEQKPREKLLRHGPGALTLRELLAVILNTGTIKEDILTLAARIVTDYGERALFEYNDVKRLMNEFSLPPGKAMQIVACGEIGRRLYQKSAGGSVTIQTAQDVSNYVQDMHHLPKEQLRGLYLDAHQRLIHDEVISIGTLNANLIHPREVFKPAIGYNAAAILLVHNHPSGVTTPSEQDNEITVQLVAVGKMVGIPLLDHVIVGQGGFTSIEVNYN